MLKLPSKMPPKGAEQEEPSMELGLEIEGVEEEEPKLLADFSLEELQAELAKRKSAPAAGKEAMAEEEV